MSMHPRNHETGGRPERRDIGRPPLRTGITQSIRPRQQSDPSEKAEEHGRVAEVQLRCRCMYCGKWKAAHALHVSFAREPPHATGLRPGAQER